VSLRLCAFAFLWVFYVNKLAVTPDEYVALKDLLAYLRNQSKAAKRRAQRQQLAKNEAPVGPRVSPSLSRPGRSAGAFSC